MSVDKLKELLAAETAARNRLAEYQNGPLQFVGDLDKLNRAVQVARDAVDTWIAQEKEKTDLQRALDLMTRERDAAQRQAADLDNRLTALTLMSEGLERERDTAAREIDAAIQKVKDWEMNVNKLGAALAEMITLKNTLSYKLGIVAARLAEYGERVVNERNELVESNEHKQRFIDATLERAAQVAEETERNYWRGITTTLKIDERIRALKGTT